MKSHARVVVIGGGAMGVGLLYHLAKEGWNDVMLIEKGELTSGSTWHAAGLVPHFIGSLNMAKVHRYGSELYQVLEEETGQTTCWQGFAINWNISISSKGLLFAVIWMIPVRWISIPASLQFSGPKNTSEPVLSNPGMWKKA